MATAFSTQLAKQRTVYGKKGARTYNTTHVNAFFDDNEDELASAQATIARPASLKSAYAVQKTEVKSQGHTLKPVKPRIKRQDTFDVPSSSDDEISPPTKRISPPKYRSVVDNDTDTSSVQPAPWERKGHEISQSSRGALAKRQRTPEGSPEAQLKQELRQATLSPEHSPRTPSTKSDTFRRTSALNSPDSSAERNSTGAAARLAARRRLLESNAPSSADERSKTARAISKRSALGSDASESTPRKRAKTATSKGENSEDIHMVDAAEEVTCDIDMERLTSADTADVYDFPDSDGNEIKDPKPMIKSRKPSAKPPRRSKLQTYKSRSLHTKGVSAPSRLTEMIATDTDTTEPSTRSPSQTPSLRSARHPPSTPPSGRIGSPETAVKASGTMTPKQAQLWDRLLPSNSAVPSPSALAMRDLTISGERRKHVLVPVRRLSKSQSDIPKRRLRLVDRLKASAPSSGNDPSDEDTDDTDMADGDEPTRKIISVPKDTSTALKPQISRSQSQSESQPQSQSRSVAAKSSMRTYANTRSHLDDSIDEIMLGFAGESMRNSPPPLRPAKKPAMPSQKSAFDLDDSDDDQAVNSQIQSIHQLRAAGSLSRGMWDIEEALEEIKQHGLAQRGRRRSALIDLATKLADKTFVTRFLGQSCELQLVAECSACADEIAEFILAAAIVLIMASEPSDHSVQGLQEQGVVSWLAKLMDRETTVSKLARDRRNNMSKAAQTSLIEFFDMVKGESSLWGGEKPQVISPRLIALKALDQLTKRLRRLGDKSELLSSDELKKIFGDPNEYSNDADLALPISLLESLSTASLSLQWPASTLENVRYILPKLEDTSPSLRHAQFLLLRLCLNLTNANDRNCALLTGNDDSTVRFLLEAIHSGYGQLALEIDDEKRTVALDLLVLAIGIMINLAEHCNEARNLSVQDPSLLGHLVEIFQQGQKHMLDAESVEESISNVTFGYLAVMLANLCQNKDTKDFIASKLPGQNLGMLIEAVEEFVRHHQKVDTMNFDGEEGAEVWGAFTEKLQVVLKRLKEVEGGARL